MIPIPKEIYMELFKHFADKLKPIQTFSDPEGILQFGNGRPRMVTVWGIDDVAFIEANSDKETRHDKELTLTYFLHTKP